MLLRHRKVKTNGEMKKTVFQKQTFVIDRKYCFNQFWVGSLGGTGMPSDGSVINIQQSGCIAKFKVQTICIVF